VPVQPVNRLLFIACYLSLIVQNRSSFISHHLSFPPPYL
jgi:hypothetical protein